ALVLEPMYFYERYAVKPLLKEVPKSGLLKDLGREEFDRQKSVRESVQNENEIMMNEFIESSKGKEILSPDLYSEAKHYAELILKDRVAQALFTGVQFEKSIYFTHQGTGLQCKVRPDAWVGG